LQTDRLGEEVLMMSDQVLTMTDEVQRRIEVGEYGVLCVLSMLSVCGYCG
jgi:hypothetical protein